MKGLTIMRMSAGVLALAAVVAQPAAAQLSSPSTAALGMGDNYTAAARGFAAAAWNPANLGLTGNPGASFEFLTMRAIAGVDPVTLGDIADYSGKVVPSNVKADWLARIKTEGSQQGTSGVDGNWLALQVGRFGFQASSTGRAIANFSPGLAQLLMFGNADSTGTPLNVDLSNSQMDLNVYSTGAVAYAMPFKMANGRSRLSVGVTAKYTMGHFMAVSDKSTGGTTTQPSVNLKFPIVHTPVDSSEGGFEVNAGGGFGLDLGVGYQTNAWTFSAVVQNIMNTFEWDESKLYYRPGLLLFDKNGSETAFDSEPLATARARTGDDAVPASLLTRVDNMKFKPVIAVGTAYKASSKLLVTGDVRIGSAEGIRVGPKTHAGAGLEYHLLPWLPIRVGAAYLQIDDEDNGSQIGGGFGLDLVGFNLAASANRRATGLGHDTILMLTVFSRGM